MRFQFTMKPGMATTAAERVQRYQDGKRRGVRAVVQIEVTDENIDGHKANAMLGGPNARDVMEPYLSDGVQIMVDLFAENMRDEA